MKSRNDKILALILALTASMTFARSAYSAGVEFIIDQFDTASETNNWTNVFGVTSSLGWDPSLDAAGLTNSGSLKITDFFIGSNGWQYCATMRNLVNPVDGAPYTNLAFDVTIDTNSWPDSNGNYGWLQVWLVDVNTNACSLGVVQMIRTDWSPWNHIELPLTYPTNSTQIRAIVFEAEGNSLTGPVVFNLDNVKLTAPPYPPSLAIQPSTSGVEFYASVPAWSNTPNLSNPPWQRQCIRTVTGNYSWVGETQPVTYSMTIAGFPGSSYNDFQCYLLLVGNSASPGGTPDWCEANVIGLFGYSWYGTPCVVVYYKTNAPNSNIWTNKPMLIGFNPSYPSQPPATVGISLQNNNLTLVWQGESIASAQFPPEVLNCFSNSTHVYVGIVPNAFNNLGQSATVSCVQITGLASPFNETFTNLNNWTVSVAQDPGGVVLHPTATFAKLTWPCLPAGFTLLESPNLSSTSWMTSTLPQVTVCGLCVGFPVTTSPSAVNFYRLRKP